ncbi:DNA-directed RNA polymerase subunit H [uncultured archaeon]|nr:DNA-directed RNA polymerase subunit H [uncultured archaeon]
MAIRRVRRKKRTAENTKKIEHFLVPKHELLKEDETKKVLEKYGIGKDQLPKIRSDDPAIQHLEVKKGDVIRIARKEDHIDNTYYRVVV